MGHRDFRVVAHSPGAGGDAEHMAHVARMMERERIALIVERWEPYAGVFSRRDLAAFIRRGEDL